MMRRLITVELDIYVVQYIVLIRESKLNFNLK